MSTPAVYNLGSLNLDRVFRVPHVAQPGETLAASSLTTYPGGKGANQSVALARAGARVVHVGRIGADGDLLRERLTAEGVDTQHVIKTNDESTGQAIIQVDDAGQNSIVILAGANGAITPGDVEAALASAPAGNWLLVQNETSSIGAAMRLAKQRGMLIAFNPAPADGRIRSYPTELIDLWCLNETEHRELHDLLPTRLTTEQEVLLTRGPGGAVLWRADGELHLPAELVEPIDTTAAGDTFLGYYLAGLISGLPPEARLARAIRAAAICVTRPGAMDSIPRAAEVTGGV